MNAHQLDERTDHNDHSEHDDAHDEHQHRPSSSKTNTENNIMTFRLQVPNALVGSIIGKQGEAVKAIREQSQAKVIIADSQPGEDRDITLRGSYQAIEQAITLIISTITQNRTPPSSSYPSSPSSSSSSSSSDHPSPPADDPFSLKLLVANDQAGVIIGKGGESVKRLREDTGARISIAKKVDFIRVVTITGTATSIRAALTALLIIVRDHPSSSRPSLFQHTRPPPPYPLSPTLAAYGGAAGYRGGVGVGVGGGVGGVGAFAYQQPSFVDNSVRCETLTIPNRSVGAIIGKGGHTINNIRSMSGCRIEVANQTEESPFRTITLTGPKRSVDVARLLIQQANSQMQM